MIFNKIFHFVKGYVIINVSGIGIERFLHMCAKNGIKLFKISSRKKDGVSLCIHIKDYKKLKPICKKTRIRLRIIKKCGLPFFIKKLKKRKLLSISMILVFVMMFLSSEFIWTIEINGVGEETYQKVYNCFDDLGLKIGALKRMLPDGEQMKNTIMNSSDNLVWAWVYIKGTKASVQCKEGIKPPKVVDRKIPCDIVAIRDGVIHKITEKNGYKILNPGDVVMAGDVIISGTHESADGTIKKVHSIGEVKAVTEHKKSGYYKLYRYKNVPTGNEKNYFTLKIFSKCFDLFWKEDPGFDDYLVNENLYELKLGKDRYLGLGIYHKKYKEIKREKEEIPYEIALYMAKNELEEKIAKELLAQSQIINKNIEHQKTDDETIKVTVSMEFIENIGKEMPIE